MDVSVTEAPSVTGFGATDSETVEAGVTVPCAQSEPVRSVRKQASRTL